MKPLYAMKAKVIKKSNLITKAKLIEAKVMKAKIHMIEGEAIFVCEAAYRYPSVGRQVDSVVENKQMWVFL